MSMNASECILSMYVNVHEFILYINVYECIWLWMNVYERIWRFWWHGNTGVYRQASQVGSFHQHKWMVSPTVSILASEDGYVLLWRIRGSSPITKTSLEVTMKNLGTLQSWSIFPYISNIWSISIHFRCWASDFSWWCSPLGWLGPPGFHRDPGVGFAVDQLLHGCSDVRSDSRLPWDAHFPNMNHDFFWIFIASFFWSRTQAFGVSNGFYIFFYGFHYCFHWDPHRTMVLLQYGHLFMSDEFDAAFRHSMGDSSAGTEMDKWPAESDVFCSPDSPDICIILYLVDSGAI